jgi:RNA polymerase sigma-70 factor (ECF subfamily)
MRLPAWEFDSVYDGFSRMVYWTAYGALKSESDAMDISQEVFIRVLRHMKKLEDMGEAQLKSWLYRVTINLCVDGKRRVKHEVLADELPETSVSNEDELPEVAAMNAETVRLIREAVDALPDIYRETVLLHYFSGMQYEEIAALQGVSEGTIKSRMSRAKGKLCEALKGGELHG